MKWFKFYGQDWNTDPKIASMSMEDRLCLLTLLTIASSEDKDGYIPSLTEEALITIARIPEWEGSDYNPAEKAIGVMERYKALHIVTLDRNGGVTVCNFRKRQGENLTNAERQKSYRNRHKTRENQRNDSNTGVVTPVTLDKTRIDKTRIPTASGGEEIPQIIKLFEVVNPLLQRLYGSPPQRRAVERLLKQFGREKLEEIISALPKINGQQYWPKSTTPVQLENNIAVYMAKKSELETKQASNKLKAVIIK